MAYSDFKLSELIKDFSLTLRDSVNLFSTVGEAESSEHLNYTLKENLPLAIAIGSEKARSEMIISPILIEVRRKLDRKVSLFSGVDFTVDPTKGLSGICDFIFSKNPEQFLIQSPVVAIVEAKNENLKSGFAQCMAEMIAAQLFNQREGNDIPIIYGVVTIGTIWRFFKLQGQVIEIDFTEYYIESLNKILGILLHILSS
ncbi:MAG: hypothetical protein KME43_09495 [Myxacorys chilensis ATA2-1-KO14]|jgi:tetrahydromethanopterin S-methyltransferase subunit G|nr:hypothetical protein [Myxacorys chilensis ATA2-1-KO14]